MRFGWRERYESRGSRTVLRGAGVKVPGLLTFNYHQKPKSTLDGNRYMGYSMVTTRYHYVEWFHWDDVNKIAGDQVGVELYDNHVDPDENVNIAGLPENQELVRNLFQQLKADWRAAMLHK